MPKSPRGNFNYIDINMYKPFNSVPTSTTPTSSTTQSHGYRASAQEAPQQQFSNPAFSPTVHVPQSILVSTSSACLNGGDDVYQSSILECPSHMASQGLGYQPQQEHQQHQRHPSLESTPRPVFDALQHHQNIHQHQQPPQQQQHSFQYQNFNQQRDPHLDNNNNNNNQSYSNNNQGFNNNNTFGDHGNNNNNNQGFNNNDTFGDHSKNSVHLDQHSNIERQSKPVPVTNKPPAGPTVQLINGYHPARLAMLQGSELTDRQSRKKARAEKAAAAAAAAAALASAGSSSSTPLTLPTPPKANIPKAKQTVPTPAARTVPNGEQLTLQLQAAITTNSSKKLTNIIKKAAGECIVRAFLYIMGRNFAFMSQDLFMTLYREAFGCPNLTDAHVKDSMLDAKLFKTMIDTKIDIGPPSRKFYRLSPVFFHVLEGRTNEQANIPPTQPKEPLFDVTNRDNLPPPTPLPPAMVRYLLDGWDLKLHNVSVMHYSFTPARWPTIAPLNDLQPFLAYWYTPQYQFSQYMEPLAAKEAAKGVTREAAKGVAKGTAKGAAKGTAKGAVKGTAKGAVKGTAKGA
ncbi:hypothetical protein BGZ95_009581, partial [Linnemannia exigua]